MKKFSTHGDNRISIGVIASNQVFLDDRSVAGIIFKPFFENGFPILAGNIPCIRNIGESDLSRYETHTMIVATKLDK